MALTARIIQKEIENGVVTGLNLECSLDDNTITHYYDLTTDDLAAVAADLSGTEVVLNGIGARECQVFCNALQAQKDVAAADVTTFDDTPVDISGLLSILTAIAILTSIIFGIVYFTAKAHKKSRPFVCSQFSTQADAQKAFKAGAKYLDGNNNGIACDSLIKK